MNNFNSYNNFEKFIQNLNNIYDTSNKKFVNKIEKKLFNFIFFMNKKFDKFNEILKKFIIRFTIIVASLSMFDNIKINHFDKIIVFRYVYKNFHLQNANTFKKYFVEIRRIDSFIKNIDNRSQKTIATIQNRNRKTITSFVNIENKKTNKQNKFKIKIFYLTRFSIHIQKKLNKMNDASNV